MAKTNNKKARVEAEKERLESIFAELDGKNKQLAVGLIDLAAFQRVELEEMKQDIFENGYTEKFQQSEKVEPYDRERPITRIYQTALTKYTDYIFKLSKMLPKEESTAAENDALGDFINAR